MAPPLDLDQLHTFITIADTGSFTKAAEGVFRTQSAVSMQMRRLEERLGKTLFEKDGRTNRLTEEGERLLIYARRLLRLNHETLAAFDDNSLEGHIRIGTPDDYADRFLPEIMARFSRSNPRVELSIICEPTVNLIDYVKRGHLDIAIVSLGENKEGATEIVRREPLLWVTSANHCVHMEDTLPLAVGRITCEWRRMACDTLKQMERNYRILFTSWSATVVIAAVLAGQAVSILPECALRPGMRILGETDGFLTLPEVHIGILRGHTSRPDIIDALARHIADSLDNISVPVAEKTGQFDFTNLPFASIKRQKNMGL